MLRVCHRPARHAVGVALTLACCLATANTATAADAGPQDADALFREGKRLLGERDYAKACPLFEASYKLDPGTGVLLAMAICREADGKLASAFAAYGDVTKRANSEGRPDRAKVARERAAAIEAKLSTLAIISPLAASLGDGVTVSRNGVAVDTQAPVALDGGRYVIEAKAKGKQAWTTTIDLAPAGDRRTVAIPVLEDDVPVTPPPRDLPTAVPEDSLRAAVTAPASTMDATSSSGRGLAVTGVVLGAASAACLGVSAFYGWRAMQKNEDSERGCDGDICDPAGRADRLAALSAGDTATAALVAATVTAAAAVTFWVLHRKRRGPSSDHATTIRGGLAFDPLGERVVFGLSFSQ